MGYETNIFMPNPKTGIKTRIKIYKAFPKPNAGGLLNPIKNIPTAKKII